VAALQGPFGLIQGYDVDQEVCDLAKQECDKVGPITKHFLRQR
jgi:hypothetical protein